jgi:hypothetical protein
MRASMNVLEVIRARVSSLPEGPHTVGLKSILRHIEIAYRHLSRGEDEGDDSAYSDAIYRSNQAFEGSIKEAYRVLAERDPHGTTPHKIEQYLQKEKLFRPRVLSQFTNYRTQWRNPSTHDYNLEFDEDEAFLAVVSVSAFAKMLVDQIAEKLAFTSVRDDIADHGVVNDFIMTGRMLIDDIGDAFLQFISTYAPARLSGGGQTDEQLLGALRGYLSSVDPSLSIRTNYLIREGERVFEADMIVSRGEESLVVELKRGPPRMAIATGLQNLEVALLRTGIKSGILLVHSRVESAYALEISERSGGIRISIIAPRGDGASTPEGYLQQT